MTLKARAHFLNMATCYMQTIGISILISRKDRLCKVGVGAFDWCKSSLRNSLHWASLLVIFVCIVLQPLEVSANPAQSTDFVAVYPTNKSAQKADMARIDLSAIAQIESSHNPKAVGDGGKALGLYQLHYGVIQDYNRAHDTSHSHRIALDAHISGQIASWYLQKRIPALLRHFKQPITLETTLTAYNMGIGNVIKGKRATSYIKKYKGLTNGTSL